MANYKRGTVYLALGKAKQALLDFDKVLELKPDFTAVRIQRGNVYLKNGDLHEAEIDFSEVVSIFLFLMEPLCFLIIIIKTYFAYLSN